jgi:hypothetical protein
MAAGEHRLTVNDLADLIMAELNQDANAGGNPPERIKSIVRRSGRYLWTMRDWKYKRKSATLTMVADTATADLASDFGKIDTQWIRTNNSDSDKYWLQFTESPSTWQSASNSWGDDTGVPRLALLIRDTTETSEWAWTAKLTPTPDAAYTYPYWYLQESPWDLATALADDAIVPWPPEFDNGWEALVKYKLASSYRADDAWRSFKSDWQDWMASAVESADETMSYDAEPIQDGYADTNYLQGLPLPPSRSVNDLPRF